MKGGAAAGPGTRGGNAGTSSKRAAAFRGIVIVLIVRVVKYSEFRIHYKR